jgi:hypothetical protein
MSEKRIAAGTGPAVEPENDPGPGFFTILHRAAGSKTGKPGQVLV